MQTIYNKYCHLIRGPLRAANAATLVASLIACLLLALGLILPQFGQAATLLAAGDIILVLTLAVLLLSRVIAKVNDMRSLISLESGLARSGYMLDDFFSEGAAGNPSLQLFLLKCLRFCKPHNVLELGSGQTTKILAFYHSANPGTHVITLEQDEGWAKLLSSQITYGGKRHDYRLCPLESRTFLNPLTARPIRTDWYQCPRDLAARQFDLILVDGPDPGGKGTDFTPYSRAGILEYLPAILGDPWILVFDDAERYGERMTINICRAILEKHKRAFLQFDIHGEKTQTVFCSPALRFLESI